ncbi:MAG: hypothetical protein AAGM22_05630 [Acidobacteriota bacterium]
MIGPMLRTLALIALGALWLGAPFLARHPILEAFSPRAEAPRLELALERLDGELPTDVAVALWWPDRSPKGLASFGHLWASASYALTPRRVFPLLPPDDAEQLDALAPTLRRELSARARELQTDASVATAVFAWGDADCALEDFPHLFVLHHTGPFCLLGTEPPPPRPGDGSP